MTDLLDFLPQRSGPDIRGSSLPEASRTAQELQGSRGSPGSRAVLLRRVCKMVRERAQHGCPSERQHSQEKVQHYNALQWHDNDIEIYATMNLSGSDNHRVKALKDAPYTQKEAEAAIGLRTDNGPRQTAKENAQDVEVEMENSGLVEE